MRAIRLVMACLAVVAMAEVAHSAVITTTFAGGNANEGNMFDLENISATGISLTGQFEGNFQTDGVAQIWYRSGSFVGHETDRTGWTLLGTGAYTTNGVNIATPYDVGNQLLIAPGASFGILMVTSSEAQRIKYTNGASVFSDGILQITSGVGIDFQTAPAGTPPINTGNFPANRIWNGSIGYTATAVPEPSTFALLGIGAVCLIGYGRRRKRKAA